MNILYKHWRSGLFRMRQMREFTKEKFSGLNFSSRVSKQEAGTADYSDSQIYESSAFAPELKKALDYCSINQHDGILDYGCGKGAVLALFSHYPFGKIAGIELSAKLVEIARENLRKLKLKDILLINADATTFKDIDEFNYFYFFNPFQGHIFKCVIDNIIESIHRHPRTVRLLYFFPVCHQVIEDSGNFELEKKFVDASRSLNIYHNM